MQKIILHCDLNNFFASATLSQNPTLKSFPVAICGDSQKRHGIVLAKNTIAKNFGIITAETIWEAKRKCSDLVILKPDYKFYETLSKKAHNIYLSFTDRVEPFGIDECWLEISNPDMNFSKAEIIANEIRNTIKKELGITVSIGVSFTKTLAKLGSDLKKPDAVTVISPYVLKEKIWRMRCSELLMVGKSTSCILQTMGIFTIGDLANADENSLKNKIGKNGVLLRKMARGEEETPVKAYYIHEKPKSIGHSATAEKDLITNEEVFSAILEFAEDISKKLKSEKLLAESVVITVLTNKFQKNEYRTKLYTPTSASMTIANTAMKLFKKNHCFLEPLRSIGIRVVNLIDDTVNKQLSLFEDDDLVNDAIDDSICNLRNKHGKNILKRAICMDNKAKPSSPGFYK